MNTQTTLIRRCEQMQRAPLPNCHDGHGALDWTTVIGGDELHGRHLKFIHDDIIPPGVTIGIHRHQDDEEYYYILSGQGVMTLDGQRYPVKPGDITAVFSQGEHGLENTSSEEMRIIVICVA
jgi:uncharacterized cupin superfamily protein